jgi:uncharacterized protein
MEKLKIINSKGLNISAVVNTPSEATSKLAILCPGFLDSKDYDHLVVLSERLVERGYTVVRLDMIGSWESEGSMSDYTTTQHLSDIKNVLDYMLTQAPYSDILIGGHSRGGMLSFLYAAMDSRITTVLGIMPSSVYTLPPEKRAAWEKDGVEVHERNIPGSTEKRKFVLPFLYVQDREPYDVLARVAEIKARIILIAGEEDVIVSPSSVEHVFDCANDPKEYILVKNIGHDYRKNADEIEIVNQVILKALPS